MPNSSGWLTAVVVSGGKQYRVAPGDRIMVDRVAAEPGSEIALERVLLLQEEGDLKVGTPVVEGVAVAARVIGHTRGPKIDVLRYKSKKRVRVHRGARADLTALEILGRPGEQPTRKESRKAAAPKPAPERPGSAKGTGKAPEAETVAAPAAKPKPEAPAANPEAIAEEPAPRAAARRPSARGSAAASTGEAAPRARRARSQVEPEKPASEKPARHDEDGE